MNQIKIIIEHHREGHNAYPIGLNGVVIGEGDTYQEALGDVTSVIRFHLESFVSNVFQNYDFIGTELG